MSTLVEQLQAALGPGAVLRGAEARERASAWSPLPCEALCVVRPANTAEVATTLAMCNAAGQALVIEGGRTGLVGATRAAPHEIALSLERMNRIEQLDTQGRTLTAQAGVILQAVHEAAAIEGLLMPVDLGARGSATIGGTISTNAGGNQVIRYGMMREQVLGLEVVLADGTVLSSLNRVLKNNTGYDLKQLFIGSEGTLGVITRAVLRLRPLLPVRNSAIVATDTMEQLVRLLTVIERALGGRMSAFEAMWKNYYRLACRGPLLGEPPLSDGYPFYALIESTGADREADSAGFEAALALALEQGLLRDAVLAQNERERAAFWAIRDNIPCMEALGPQAIFDISLPIGAMQAYLARCAVRLDALLGRLDWVCFGHLGDGNLHLAIGLGREEPARRHGVEQIIYGELDGLGGSISAEHGIGLDKRDWLAHSRTAGELALMRQLKSALDPRHILNPGRIFLPED